MRRRVGRPGLVGTMARTAAIAGTATAVSGSVARRQQGRAEAQAQEAQYAAPPPQQEYAPAPPPPPAAPAGGTDDLMDQLQKLAEMKAAGILDDAEFAAAKAKILS